MNRLAHGNLVEGLHEILGLQDAARSTADMPSPQLFFDRLLPKQLNQPSTEQLEALAASMEDQNPDSSGDSDVPAGITFLGQFIDHDLTLDAFSTLGVVPAGQIPNLRTPRLDLDSLYRSGPSAFPYLYDRRFRFVVGTPANAQDLPRNNAEVALIGDPRNDENLFISQMHALFLHYHNVLLEEETAGKDAEEADFDTVRKLVESHYQSIVLNEYLPAIVDPAVLAPLVAGFRGGSLPGPVDWTSAPDMPFEFAAAAFRFGHSQVRPGYRANATQRLGLFGRGGFQAVPEDFNITWNFFFDLSDGNSQVTRKIDTLVSRPLFQMPPRVADPNGPSLPFRNLVRGQLTFLLPFGEDIAAAWGFEPITHDKVVDAGLSKTPLWFYVLAEAEVNNGKLGPVGGTIVAGTILNLLLRDGDSIAHNGMESNTTMRDIVEKVFG